MKIGELFWELLIQDQKLVAQAKASGAKAGTAAGDASGKTMGERMAASLRKNFKGEDIGKGLVQGLGLAGGLGAARLFEVGVQRLGDVIGDATQAAIAEEASIQKLGTALRANVPAWDGQTQAIEDVLKARMDLGFSDDEQRQSLASIVVATKDVNKALAVQRVAMDLSRLKGISLADAGNALIKVEGGQFRALKALGIELPKNATATDALAAVQKAAAGQAEDYAKINAGKLLVSQIQVDEAFEKFGAKTMPIVVGATVAGTDALTDVVNVLDLLTDGLSDNEAAAREQAGSIFDIVGALGAVIPGYSQLADAAKKSMDETANAIDNGNSSIGNMRGRAVDDFAAIKGSMGTVEDASGDLAKAVKDDNKVVTTSWAALRKALADNVLQMITGVFEPIETKNELAASNAEAAGARRIIASASATRAEKADARDLLDSTVKDQASALVTLAEAGMANSATYKTGLKSLETYAETTSGKTRRELDLVIAKIKEVEREGKSVPINVVVNRRGNLGASGARAEGGPVRKGLPYLVNEDTPRSEMFVPEVSGRILTVPEIRQAFGPKGGTARTAVSGAAISTAIVHAITRSVSNIAREVSETSIVLRKVVERVERTTVPAGPTITVPKPGYPAVAPLALTPVPARAVAQAVQQRVKQMREAMLPGPWMPAAAMSDVGGSLRPPAAHVPSFRAPSIAPARVPSGLAAVPAAGGPVTNNATYNVPLLDRVEVRSVRDIGGSLKMLGEMGYLPHPGQRPPPGMPARRRR